MNAWKPTLKNNSQIPHLPALILGENLFLFLKAKLSFFLLWRVQHSSRTRFQLGSWPEKLVILLTYFYIFWCQKPPERTNKSRSKSKDPRDSILLLQHTSAMLHCYQFPNIIFSCLLGVLKISENLSDHNIWRRNSQTYTYNHYSTVIFSIRYHIFANRAAKEIQQPHTANRPNLVAL